MTRLSSTYLKALLLIAGSALYSGAVSAVPAIWEAQLGATVTTIAAPALDNSDNANTGTVIKFGSMSFLFAGITYTGTTGPLSSLNISDNGYISLGGSNAPFDLPPSGGNLTAGPFPRIAPFWTDLDPKDEGGDVYINRFDDTKDGDTDRIVITFATGHKGCDADECRVLTQVQLIEGGTIIFGYNGIDLDDPGSPITTDLLVGVSPGAGAGNPGSTDLSAIPPTFDSGAVTTVYKLFSAAPAFDLDDGNLVFTPNLAGGFAVSDSMLNAPASTEPPTWESQLGATVTDTFANPALDDFDDADTGAALTFGTMTFPFYGIDYDTTDVLNISSNGFISLGGDNGDGCDATFNCEGDVTGLISGTFPRIAPFWTDLDPGEEGGDIYINRIDDDDPVDGIVDRIVITFATGINDCDADECRALTQVQLLKNGTIIFGYNGIDLTNANNDANDDVLVGISPGIGAANPGNTNISRTAPFNSGPATAIYELFKAPPAPKFDLDGGNVIFTPDGGGGFDVTAPGVSGTAIGGAGGGSGGSGHCSLADEDAPFEPTLWLLLLVSIIYLGRRRLRAGPAR